jgi:hypothetical protein
VFSSDFSLGGINRCRQANVDPLPMFITMDPPKHDIQRRSSPLSPRQLYLEFSAIIPRTRLATLFDFPFEERRKLTR